MKKLKSTLPNMILSLGLITVLSGALLGLMYKITAGPIAAAEKADQTSAIAAVLPAYDNDPEAQKTSVIVDGEMYEVYPAYMGGKLVGGAVRATSMAGFAGEVTVMVGFDADGNVVDYRVLRQAETPGLGAKMGEWFRDPSGARRIIGKSPATTKFVVSKDGGDIDGITAATISSRAFLGAVRQAYTAYRDYASANGAGQNLADAHSGASHQVDEEKAEDNKVDEKKADDKKVVKESASSDEDAHSGASHQVREKKSPENKVREKKAKEKSVSSDEDAHSGASHQVKGKKEEENKKYEVKEEKADAASGASYQH